MVEPANSPHTKSSKSSGLDLNELLSGPYGVVVLTVVLVLVLLVPVLRNVSNITANLGELWKFVAGLIILVFGLCLVARVVSV